MSVISIVSVPEVTADDQSAKTIVALFSCIGLVVSLCVMVAGVDLSPALI